MMLRLEPPAVPELPAVITRSCGSRGLGRTLTLKWAAANGKFQVARPCT